MISFYSLLGFLSTTYSAFFLHLTSYLSMPYKTSFEVLLILLTLTLSFLHHSWLSIYVLQYFLSVLYEHFFHRLFTLSLNALLDFPYYSLHYLCEEKTCELRRREEMVEGICW
jgi:hypothetical protein